MKASRDLWSMRSCLRLPFPPSCVPTTTISIIPTTVLLLFIPPAGFNLSRALLCELFQIQSMPASMAIEFCFHYAGFLGSFKLILILSSLLRPLKRAVFPPSLVNWDLSHFTGTAFSLARAACPYIPVPLSVPGQWLADYHAVGGSPPVHWESTPSPLQPGQHPEGSDGLQLSKFTSQHALLFVCFALTESRHYENKYSAELIIIIFYSLECLV